MGFYLGQPFPVWADGLQERGSADLVSTNSIK